WCPSPPITSGARRPSRPGRAHRCFASRGAWEKICWGWLSWRWVWSSRCPAYRGRGCSPSSSGSSWWTFPASARSSGGWWRAPRCSARSTGCARGSGGRPWGSEGGVPRARRSVLAVADEAGAERAASDRREPANHGGGEQARVRHGRQMLGDPPYVLAAGHPAGMPAVEGGEVDRARERAERALTPEVHVVLEVAHRQFARRAVDRLPVAQPREVRLGDRAPVAAHAEHRDDVIRVLHRLEIQQQRGEAHAPE